MATVVLVRHARSTANASGVLTGRLKGVHLDDDGTAQAERAGQRLAAVPLAAVVSSPLERCKETARADRRGAGPSPRRWSPSAGLVECDYGEWQGRPLKDLSREKLWKVVQRHPASVTFPAGESMAAMSARAVVAVRRHDALVEAEHGPHAVWAAVTHGDLVKAILADALGLHLDQFQRLHVDPASMSVVRYTSEAAYVLQSNTHDGDLAGWRRGRARRRLGPASSVVARVPLEAVTRVETVPIVHTFDPPERFVAGTVGEPGERTFFLQAREGARVVSVALEKQQVVALAERMDQLLDELMKSDTREVVPAVAPLDLDDAEPLEQPIVEEFRAGTMTLSWDPDDERVVIEVFPYTEAAVVAPDQVDEDVEEPEPDELLLVRLPAAAARSFVQARRAGRRGRAPELSLLRQRRSTPRATSASGPTGSSAATREPARRGADPPRSDHAGLQRHLRRRDRRRPGRLQAGGGGAAALGLPRRHPGPPGGGGVRRLRGARLGRRAAHHPPGGPARARHGAGVA